MDALQSSSSSVMLCMMPLLGARKSVNALGIPSNGVVDGVGGGVG
jgi:hypothetical protein